MRLTKEELLEIYVPQSSGPSDRSRCPTEEQLALASTDEMSRSEIGKVTAHLLTCRDCAEEYRLIHPLRAFSDRAAVAPGRVEAGEKRSKPAGGSWWERMRIDLLVAQPGYAIAALLLVVSVAFGAWLVLLRQDDRHAIARLQKEAVEREQAVVAATESLEETRRRLDETTRQHEQDKSIQGPEGEIAQLRREVEELSRPQLNAPIVNLEPRGSERGGAPASTVVEIPSGASVFTLVLNITGQQSFSSYALDISDPGGKVIWQGHGLRKSTYNTFTVALSRRLLPAGQYHLKLYGTGGIQRKLVEDFAVRIHYGQ